MGSEAGGSVGQCPSCAAVVEADWLTCRSCGAILAAVRRPPSQTWRDPGVDVAPIPEQRELDASTDGPSSPVLLQPSTVRPSAGPTDEGPIDVAPSEPVGQASAAAPPAPTAPAVHTAAIPPAAMPASRAELGPNQWYSGTAAAPVEQDPPKPGLFADLPLAVPNAGGRLALVGLLMIAIAFFLPWSPLLSGISYFDAWGFSRSSRLVVFVIDLVLLVLVVQPLGLSLRVRTGWLPLVFGVFVVGVFWERVDSLAVVGIGAWLFALGGLLTLVGGVLSLVGRDAVATADAAPPAGS
ncbi:MAG TPA: hypothetical protein VIF84_02300 [Candidatus Limnocylindrales bacterium]